MMRFSSWRIDARHERDDPGLAAFAENPQRPMAALNSEVLDICGTRLRDPKAVQAEQDGQGGVVVVIALGGEDEPTELEAVQAATLGRVNLGPPHVLRRVRRDPAVNVREAVLTDPFVFTRSGGRGFGSAVTADATATAI